MVNAPRLPSVFAGKPPFLKTSFIYLDKTIYTHSHFKTAHILYNLLYKHHTTPSRLPRLVTILATPQYRVLDVGSRGGLPNVDSCSGLFPKISSILLSISGVNFGMTSNAFKLSATCSGFDAPRITVLVYGFFATHAKAR